jgi:activating signal cointegrator complex subunit 1
MPRLQGHRKPPAAARPPLTHFLCLPLLTVTSRPQLEANISLFREDVCAHQYKEADNTNVATRIHPKAIRPAGVMHCTLGVMSLDQQQLDKATDLLKSLDVTELLSAAGSWPGEINIDSQISPSERPKMKERSTSLRQSISPPGEHGSKVSSDPIKIDLKGLVSMHAPQKTSILYIEPRDPSGRLYRLGLALQNIFKREGILVHDERELKLHVTLVNTIYVTGRKSQGHGPNAKAALRIDARDVLQKYQDSVWAKDVVIDRIAICEMGAKKRIENGGVVSEEYTEVASVSLVNNGEEAP